MKAIQFSGGKDSLACLHLYRDDPDAVVLYADSGSPFPHMREFVHRTVAALGMRLHVVRPEVSTEEWQDANGLPADIVPIDSTPLMRNVAKERFGATLVPYVDCCNANLWQPMMRGVAELGAVTVVRGSKACDSKVGVPHGHMENGIVYLSPLWDWSDDDVFEYLKRVGAELPPQYAIGADSLDCWCCTAYMNAHGVKRFAYLKENHPELYARAKVRLEAVNRTLAAAIGSVTLEA